MKHTPRKVFIIEDGNYIELTPEEHERQKGIKTGYADKKFILVCDCLLEVSEEFYLDYYKTQRKEKYLKECSVKVGMLSYDMLSTDELNGEDILIDYEENIPEQVGNKIMIEKLRRVLLLLPKDEEQLIREHYFEGISQMRLGELYGVNQSSINRKIKKILTKIKKLLEI